MSDANSEFSFMYCSGVKTIKTKNHTAPISTASTAHAFTQYNLCTSQIPSTWVLLDSQSTVSVFKSKSCVSKIQHSNTILHLHKTSGTQTSNQHGVIRILGMYDTAQIL